MKWKLVGKWNGSINMIVSLHLIFGQNVCNRNLSLICNLPSFWLVVLTFFSRHYAIWFYRWFLQWLSLMSLTWIHEYTVSCVLPSKMLTGVVMIFLYFPTSIVCMSSTYVKMKKKKATQHKYTAITSNNNRNTFKVRTHTCARTVFLFVSLLYADPIQCRLAVYTLCSQFACMYVLAV